MASDGKRTRLNRPPTPTRKCLGVWLALFLIVLLAATCLPAVSDPLLTLVSVPAAGGTTTGGGVTYPEGSSLPITATPNGGYSFVAWTTDAAGLNVVSAYSYKMPATDTTLYAQFSVGSSLFSENFESYADGSMLAGQGWWKDDFPGLGSTAVNNQKVYASQFSIPQLSGSTRYSAAQAASHQDGDAVNLAYHLGGANLTGNFLVDWYFYDPVGTTTAAVYNDNLCLSTLSEITGNPTADISAISYTGWVQRFQVGATTLAGFDGTKYQIRCLNSTGGISGGVTWHNTTCPRSVGWHEGMIRVGAAQSDTTNRIVATIDGNVIWNGNSLSKTGYNLLEINSGFSTSSAAFDNVRLVSTQWPSVNNLAVAPSPVTTRDITVSWTTSYADHSLFQLDSGDWVDPATSPYALTLPTWGAHTVNVKAVNADGQVSPTASVTFTADLLITGLAVAPTPVPPGTSTVATWGGTGTPDHFLVQIDGGTWSTQTSPYTIDTTGMAYGSHTVAVRAVAVDGYQGTVSSATFLVDRSILTWNIIGQYPWQWGTAAGSTRWATDMFTPATTELLAGSKTGLSYPSSTVQPTPATSDGTTSVPGATCNSAWTPYTSPTPTLDMNIVYNTITPIPPATTPPYTQYGVSYLCTYVWNSGAAITDAYLTCGSDDGIKAYFDGAYIGGNNVYRGVTIDGDLYGPFTINSGGNKLLLKLTQGGTGYGIQAQLCDSTKHELPAVTSGQITYTISDDTPPTGAVVINGGAATTNALLVTLTCSAADDLNGVVSMQFANEDLTWSDPIPFAPTAPWTLSEGPGLKTVYAKYIDGCGNVSAEFSDTITVPEGGQLTLPTCDALGGTPQSPGSHPGNESVTVHANPNAGYTFVNWTRDGCGGYDVASTSANYTFNMPFGDLTLYANYSANSYTMTATACANGTTTGSGSYTTNSSVTVTATPSDTYRFVKWTSDSCGGTVSVSTNASYTFSMPPNNYTLYANFEYMPLLTLVSVPTAGGTTSPTTPTRFNKSQVVAISATANTGYGFMDWTSDSTGLTVLCANSPWSYTMPATDTTIYAQFISCPTYSFFENFESRTKDGRIAGQGWWTNDYYVNSYANNQVVRQGTWSYTTTNTYNITQMTGSTKYLTAAATGDKDNVAVNLAYHMGSGANLTGNFIVDWWFYDPIGTGTNGKYFVDTLNLSSNTDVPTSSDPTGALTVGTWNERIMVGAAPIQGTGFDVTKYQVRCFGITNGYAGGPTYVNTPIARSVGWHNGRIYVGPVLANPAGKNLISVYIDNKLGWEGNSGTTVGYNFLEVIDGWYNLSTDPKETGAHDNIRLTDNTLPYLTNFTATAATTYYYDNTSPVISWVANNATRSQVQIDSGAWTDATSPYSSLDTTGLYGAHTVSVRCLDAAGQSSPILTSPTYTIDHNSIRTWNIIGSYGWDGTVGVGSTRYTKDFFDAPFISEPTMCAKTGVSYATSVTPAPRAAWQPYTSPTRNNDLIVLYGSQINYGVSYFFDYVVNSGAPITNAYFTCGTDDGNKVWFNGTYLGGIDRSGGVGIDQFLYGPFTINTGVNRLLVKVTQITGGYALSGRLTDVNKGFPSWLSQVSFVQSDDTAPTGTIVIDGGATTTNGPNVTLTLSATDSMTDVRTMAFSADGGTTWSSAEAYGTTKTLTLTGDYGLKTICVKYADGAGNVSAPICGTITWANPCQPPTGATPVLKISDIWLLANDATVYELTGRTVSAMWSDGFWVEETNRSAGIKVLYNPSTACTVGAAIAVGNSVDVYGTFSTGDMRVMTASVVVNNGAGTAVEPVIVTEKYSGGHPVNAITPAVTGGKGIYGVGLLVKIAGAITLNVPSGDYYLDDGSGLLDGTINGIKVISLTTPPTGNKMVTGVIGIIAGKPVIYATNIQ